MSNKLKRTSLDLDFEHSVLLGMRRSLFKKGITPQQFFRFIASMLITNDPRLIELVDEACEYKTERSLRTTNNLDADDIYALIERSDRLKHQQQGE